MVEKLLEEANELVQSFANRAARVDLIALLSKVNDSFTGKNQDGEDILISANESGLVLRTYQHNGWIRINYYDECGFESEESFEGKWK